MKDEFDKDGALKSMLRKLYGPQNANPGKVLIFAFDHDECESLSKKIKSGLNSNVETLHANKKQADRETAMARFRSGESKIMVATSVAGRGLDLGPEMAFICLILFLEALIRPLKSLSIRQSIEDQDDQSIVGQDQAT